jgi:ATP-binding cassette subfamily B protein
MAWGGGWGGGVGVGPPGAPVAGLPFGGIQSELQKGVDLLLADEPEQREPTVVFSQQASADEGARLTLWRLLLRYPGMLVISGVLIVILSVALQVGPWLTKIAIQDGMIPDRHHHYHFSVVVLAAVAYLVATTIGAVCQRSQVKVTGRLAAGVMNDLRITVFTHLQRLSLD